MWTFGFWDTGAGFHHLGAEHGMAIKGIPLYITALCAGWQCVKGLQRRASTDRNVGLVSNELE